MAIEQQITISFRYGQNDLKALHQLSRELDRAMSSDSLGEVDGHEIATDLSHGFLYLYGPSAEAMFKAVKEVLLRPDFMKGATAILKFKDGKEVYPECEVELE